MRSNTLRRKQNTKRTARLEALEHRLLLTDIEPPAFYANDDLSQPDNFWKDPAFQIPALDEFEPLGTGSNAPAARVKEPFSVQRFRDEFMVFDDMYFTNEPDFVGTYGMEPIELFDHKVFFKDVEVGNQITEDEVRIKASEHDISIPLVINLEHWSTSSDTPGVVDQTIERLSNAIDIIREEAPGVTLAIYSMFPIRDYWVAVNPLETERFATWQEKNERLRILADKVDFIIPSLYTFYVNYEPGPDDYDGSQGSIELAESRWAQFAIDNIEEARRYGKPVVPYIWPFYHGGSGPDVKRYWQYEEIDEVYWSVVLETVREHADSVVIWQGIRGREWNENAGWWKATEEFLARNLPARAVDEETTYGDRLHGDYRSTHPGADARVSTEVSNTDDAPILFDDDIQALPNDQDNEAENTTTFNVLEDNGFGVDGDPDVPLYVAELTFDLSEPYLQSGLKYVGDQEGFEPGDFQFTPEDGFNGEITFTYSLTDEQGLTSDPATVTVFVNHRPTLDDTTVTTLEDVPLTLELNSGEMGLRGTDIDGTLDANTIQIMTPPRYGKLAIDDRGTDTTSDDVLIYPLVYLPRKDHTISLPQKDSDARESFQYRVKDDDGAVSLTATVTIGIEPVDDPAVAKDDFVSLEEDSGPLVINVLNQNGEPAAPADSDVDNVVINPDSIVIIDQPQFGSLVVVGEGEFSYEPDLNFYGTDTFTYRIEDSETVVSNLATVMIEVTPVNDPPIARDDSVTMFEDGPPLVFNPLNDNSPDNGEDDADSDVEPEELPTPNEIEIESDPTNGSVSVLSDGTVQYAPNENFSGVDQFTYTIVDSEGARSEPAVVSVTVVEVNDIPHAVDDLVTTPPATPIVIRVLDDNGNGVDSDVEDGLVANSVIEITSPSNGTLQNNHDGTFLYSPSPGFFLEPPFNDVDSFTYTIDDIDGATSNEATVFINVNHPPTANDFDIFMLEDEERLVEVLIDNGGGNDLDGTIDSIEILRDPDKGALTLNEEDRNLVYIPNLNFFGTDTFVYRLFDNDGAASEPATVTLTIEPINDVPVAVDDHFATTPNSPILVNPIDSQTGPDSDVEGGIVATLTFIAQPPMHGTLDNNADGTFLYTPDPDFEGDDTFTYTIADNFGQRSLPATVAISVTAENIAPIALDDIVHFVEDQIEPMIIEPLVDNGNGQDMDVEDMLDPSSITIVTPPSMGDLQPNDDGTFTYVQPLNAHGEVSFTYTVNDRAGATSNLATVVIVIASVNDPPIATDKSKVLAVNEEWQFNVLDDHGNGGDYDVDVDDQLISQSIDFIDGPTFGTLKGLEDFTFLYTPHVGASGIDTIRYTIEDNNGAVSEPATLTIIINAAPIAVDDVIELFEDTPTTFNVAANDTDSTGEPDDGSSTSELDLNSISLVTEPTRGELQALEGGEFRYIPEPNDHGVYTFSYTIRDQYDFESLPATVTLKVVSVNDLPIANDDEAVTFENRSVAINVLMGNGTGEDSDLDGELNPSTVTAFDPENGTVETLEDGSIVYTPDFGFFGTDSFTYHVSDSDGGTSNEATVTVTVREVNMPPVAVDGTIRLVEETTVSVIDILTELGITDANDVDGTIDPASFVIVRRPTNGTLFDNGDGTYRYTPNDNFQGIDTFTYRFASSDGQTSRVFEVLTEDLDVENDVSRLQHTWRFDLHNRFAESIRLEAIHDSYEEDFTFQYSLDETEWHDTGILIINELQTHVFEFPAGVTGDLFVRAIDLDRTPGKNLSDHLFVGEMLVRHTPFPSPSLPTISISDASFSEAGMEATLTISLNENDVADRAVPVVMSVRIEQGSTEVGVDHAPILLRTAFILPGEASTSIKFDIHSDDISEPAEDFVVQLSSPVNGIIANGTARITIEASDPVAVDDLISLHEDSSAYAFSVLADHGAGSDLHFDDDHIVNSVDFEFDSDLGELSHLGQGQFEFTPVLNGNGETQFTYTLTDSADSKSEPATVTLIVASVNDAPVNETPIQVLALDADPVLIQFQADDGDPELEQTLSYVLTSLPNSGQLSLDEEGLQPILAASLPLTLSSNQVWFAPVVDDPEDQTIEFFVLDDGGVENGGMNRSENHTVTISQPPRVVLAVPAAPLDEADESFLSSIVATLSKPAFVPVTINLALTGSATRDDDFTIPTLQIQIPANETRGELVIRSLDDSSYEVDETLIFEIESVIGAQRGEDSLVTAIITSDDAPTQVTQVFVSSSAWTDTFRNHLGSDLGFAIPAGAQQQRPLPWSGVDEISIVFNRSVTISESDLMIAGLVNPNFDVESFKYEPSTFTARWKFVSPFANDKLLLRLSEEIIGDDESVLDGDWANESFVFQSTTGNQITFPSGDGTPGGLFEFRINVLVGDTNGTQAVAVSDLGGLRFGLGRSAGSDSYSIFSDLNGSGAIGVDDVAALRENLGLALPTGEPTLAVAARPLDIDLVFAASDEDDDLKFEDLESRHKAHWFIG